MKKKVFASLLLTGMVLGLGQAAFAEEKLPTGYDEIDNGDGTQYDPATGVEIPVNGTLGKLDNTDENENIPEGDDRWIHVTLPTSVAFNTNPEDNTKISAYKYNVKNLSGRPIQVNLASFSGDDVPAISTLELAPSQAGEKIELVKDGKVTATEQELVSNLAAKTGDYEFTYSGNVDPTKIKDEATKDGESPSQKVSYKMNLKFEVLNADGTPVIGTK
ncbi:hypothetical protein ABZ134_002869 [Listeria monocytogenes]|uniref:hypothetical protein n=1 Tax=Listeria TaxID=1637 RepID=UPI0011EB2D2A|nr:MULTISPECIES: hypothetical protein [Listeria]EHZ7795111.1 hypothetical protein [Listeria monocytogenes]EHZ7802631.1 hypothetical protein [Listeria monocytogenes]EHZ7811334.1 hypothetical protein [Listeria monocytogenes]MBF2682784.1 hypothetical protein [Listeria welshimeri]TYV75315.1 hypothetical protein FZ061_10460 [Listeria monocytogenes]